MLVGLNREVVFITEVQFDSFMKVWDLENSSYHSGGFNTEVAFLEVVHRFRRLINSLNYNMNINYAFVCANSNVMIYVW